jgi:hypothetical protein
MWPEFAGDVPATGSTTHYAITLRSARIGQVGASSVSPSSPETAALDQVYFQLFPNSPRYGGQLDLRDVRVGGQSVKTALETESTALAVPLAPALSPGDAAVIDLAYTVKLPAGAPGYNPFGYHDGVLALANVYPLIPAYDESGWRLAPALDFGDTVFSDVALYDVTITAPAGQVLAASGVCQPAVGPATPAGVADAAIDRPLEEYASQQYLDVVYGKAPLFFDAVHGAAGDGAFRRFLRDYFSARRYAIAGPAELRAALAEIIDAEQLDAIYGRWTRAQPCWSTWPER